MMKKVFAMLVILAMVCMSSMAFAADVTMGGTMEIMSRDYQNLDLNKNTNGGATDSPVYTLERVRVDLNAKAGDVKGKITLENDFDTWGRFETNQGTTAVATGVTNTTTGAVSTTKVSRLGIREAWMLFPVADTGIFIKGGHMNLALGQGQFFSSMRYGSDAWVAYKDIDTMHVGLVNVKVAEGTNGLNDDDTDAYVLVATNKFGDAVAGLDITSIYDRNNNLAFNTTTQRADTNLINLGLNYKGAVGPVALKAELDLQSGKAEGDTADKKFKGNLIYVNGAVDMNPVTINFTLARGTGDKVGGADYDGFKNFIDTNGHYTLMYEYMINSAAGAKNKGFVNTTAISAGAMFAATKNLKIGADVWVLQATEKCNLSTGELSNDAGTEVDVKLLWKLADNVNWNWTLGYFAPGGIYKSAPAADGSTTGTDSALGLQGLLTMTM
jgi:hypothetical protein